MLLRQPDQFHRLGRIVRHGFFHEQMPPAREQFLGDGKMRDRGGDDVERVTVFGRVLDRGEGAHIVFRRVAPRRLGVGVEDAGEGDGAGRRHPGIKTRVFLAQRAGADHGDPDRVLLSHSHERESASVNDGEQSPNPETRETRAASMNGIHARRDSGARRDKLPQGDTRRSLLLSRMPSTM